MYSIPVWRGPAGGLEPEDRVRVDAAIETAETINARIGEATEAAEIATEAAAATDADAQATEAGRQQAVQAAGDAAAARAAAEQERQAAEAAALSAQPYASRAVAQATTIPGALNYISIDGLLYRRDPLITSNIALTTGGGVNWSPAAEITPFHFGDGAAGWQVEISAAIAYAAASGRLKVAIPSAVRSELQVTGRITAVSGVDVYGIGNPTLVCTVSGIINQTDLTGFGFRGMTLSGPYSGTSFMIRLEAGCSRCHIDLEFVNTNSGIAVTGASDNVIKAKGRNIRGTFVKLSGAGAYRNIVLDADAENCSGFGVYVEYGACENRIDSIRKFVNLASLPDAQKAGTQWDEAKGRLGLEALGVAPDCLQNSFGSIVAVSTHDNGVSISGDYNSVSYVYAENCAHEGLHFYGSRNTCGFLHAVRNQMSGAGASAGEMTQVFGSWNTILNGIAMENGYNAVRYGAVGDNNDFRVRSINNVGGDYRNDGGANNRFNAFPSGLDTTYQAITGLEDQLVQTVTSSTRAPRISQVKKGTGETDVSAGTTLGVWDIAGWLTGIAQSAARISVVAASTANGILRGRWRFEVRNAEGAFRPALVIDPEGRLGVARRTATAEYLPSAELDVDGVARLAAATLKSVALADYAGAAIDATYASALHIAPVAGGATLGAITSSAVGEQILVIKNTSANPLTIPHSATGIRTAAGRDVVLGAYKSILLIRASGAVWDEIGAPRPSDFLAFQNTALAAYDGSPVDATGRGVLSIAPAATGTVLGALSSSTSGYHVVVIVNTSANTLVIPHATSAIRLNGKTNVTLGAYESITLMHIIGTIWQQI
ncbi:hypothetical protein PY32053_01634 [Paracoccus yeei]|uniref:Depolymerase 2 capsule K5-specific C-terminal domain-containing protein n=2 Tax=Paracoccus yeei TaxID=147645 RepID=A0A386UL55_9RHOB|nr:hypothetical protein [Paracoccus yeei]AYF01261.1 hypothetical protein PY32053_01634 [Paracoccus yeei]